MATKTRVIEFGRRTGRQITKNFLGAVIADVDTSIQHNGFELTLSSSHPKALIGSRWFRGDAGGAFTNAKVYLQDFSPTHTGSWTNGPWGFQRSGIVPVKFAGTWNAKESDISNLAPVNDLVFYGTEGYSNADPIRPKSQLTTALFELREGIPVVNTLKHLKDVGEHLSEFWSRKRFRFLSKDSALLSYEDFQKAHTKALAEGYLTWEFEWLPFLGDVKNFMRDVKSAQLEHELWFNASRQRTRRRRNVASSHVESVVQTASASTGALPMITQAYTKSGVIEGTSVTTREYWFSGAFEYYIPPPQRDLASQLAGYESVLRRQFGLELNPRSLYQAIPWSWLLDWCSDTGAILSNFTDLARDNLASNYAYIMCETKATITYTLSGLVFSDGSPPLSGSQSVCFHNKQRIAASPFGFAVSPTSFTERQWALLDSLGISRGFHQL